ncbi:hypothetical protein SFC88_04530, partial [Nocardioides sp. HM23]|uniref:hypothetical protein n=1 Tax=Nocardioides bizhenqiangii TaxID=3095076 RepID=UPI002ACAB34A
MTVERLIPDALGTQFVRDLDIPQTANALRKTAVAPGMISYLERAMLTNLVARTWRGEGAIIDGGSFFGSSIVALAEGIRDNDVHDRLRLENFPDGKPIHGYELGFLPLPEGRKEQVRVWHGIEYRFGESFVPILEKTVAPFEDLVRLHIGDLTEETWPHDAPIEIAFIDVCKTIQLNAHVSREFYPALIPGASTLINQDFFFDRLPWIKVTMGYLKDYFRWEGQVLSSSIYRSIKEVPADVAAFDPFVEASYEECLEMHDAVKFPGLDRRFEFRTELSRAYLMTLKGHKDEALDTLKALESEYADILGDNDVERGQQFRYDRAVKQISNDMIFKVSHSGGGNGDGLRHQSGQPSPDRASGQTDGVERLIRDALGTQFVRDLDIPQTADGLRDTAVAPGMISYLERAMLTNLVARTWRGEGAIIDGGSFFGSSIVALAEGIRDNDVHDRLRLENFPDGKPIHGYELGFLPLPEGRKEQVRVWHGIEYRFGESFVPILEKTVAPFEDLVRLHIGDLTEETWPHDAP